MKESSSQSPSSPEITPKEEPVTLNKSESPNPFLPANQDNRRPKTRVFTPVVGEIHKEAQQAAGDPTSLRATNKEGAHPHLSSDQTKSARDGLKTTHTDSSTSKESNANDISKKIKMKDLSDLLKDTRSTFFTPDSPQDEPIIVSDESKEEETEKDEDSHATSHNKKELEQQKATAKAEVASPKAKPPYPDINQLTDLLVTSLKPAFSKLLASHDFASCLPTELKKLPSKFTKLSGEIKELKKHVKDMEIELPGDLIEIPTKLETFTFTISILVSSVQKRLKTLVSLPSLLNKVTETLNRFATMMEIASRATTKDVLSAGQATASPAEGEKNTTKDAETNLQNELVDLLGIDVVEQYHNKKLLFDNYCVKMMKRRKSSKIINCDVLTQKGPISLKVYGEDGTIEVIANFKVSDLHLAEWREVVHDYPDRKEKRWKPIYGLIKTRMEYIDQTEKELKIDFNKPLKEQDPLNELNELANKKRKRTSYLKDHSSGTETEEGLWLELQFNLVDNSKLKVAYLLKISGSSGGGGPGVGVTDWTYNAFYAIELHISSPDPITSQSILTPISGIPLSYYCDPRYLFVP
ncbi:hypothetical protein Tco_0587775 [Tanacetum coccineum]